MSEGSAGGGWEGCVGKVYCHAADTDCRHIVEDGQNYSQNQYHSHSPLLLLFLLSNSC